MTTGNYQITEKYAFKLQCLNVQDMALKNIRMKFLPKNKHINKITGNEIYKILLILYSIPTEQLTA